MEWMAAEGWLPGTERFDAKRFEKKPDSLKVKVVTWFVGSLGRWSSDAVGAASGPPLPPPSGPPRAKDPSPLHHRGATVSREGSFPSAPPRRHGVARLARSRCATTAPATSKTSARASATAAEGQLASVAASQSSSRRRTTAATMRGRRQSIALRRPRCRGDSAGGSSPSSPLIRRPRPVTARSARAVLSRAVLGCFSGRSARVLLGSLSPSSAVVGRAAGGSCD